MAARLSIYKSPAELRAMVEPGRVTAAALGAVAPSIRAGVTTLELDAIAERVIRNHGARPNFMLEPGYRHTICASVNDDVVHGIPGGRALEPGDIVSIDCGAEAAGFHGDAAITVVVPDDDQPDLFARRTALAAVTEGSLWAGIAALAGARQLNEVGAAIEDYIDGHGGPGIDGHGGPGIDGHGRFGILEDYVGHGIGRAMHEEPPVFNFRARGKGAQVQPGLVVAIEPMVTAGGIETFVRTDDWTVATTDGSDAAHWEHSVAVHAGGIWVLTAVDGGAGGLEPFGVVPAPIPVH